MKSAKSRNDSVSTRASLAIGLDTTFRLGDGLWFAATGPGPLFLENVLFGRLPVPNWLSSALTRGYTVTFEGGDGGLGGSAVFGSGVSSRARIFWGVSVNLTVSLPFTSESNSRSRSSSDMRPLSPRDRWLAVDSRPLDIAVAPFDLFADEDDDVTRFNDALSDSDLSWEKP